MFKLSEKELERCRKIFDSIDTDHSGGIDMFELYHGMKKFSRHITIEDMYIIFKEFDSDNSGEIDFEEFVQAITKLNPKIDNDNELLDIFIALGGDKDGVSVKTDNIIKYLNDFEIEFESTKLNELMVKPNYNGYINFEQFKDIFF